MDNTNNTMTNPMTDAFRSGLQSSLPAQIWPGMLTTHKDIILHDQTAKWNERAKREFVGPVNPAGMITCLTIESFMMAVNDNADKRTAIFADADGGKISAVFDFLEKGGLTAADAKEDPRERGWCQFGAIISFHDSRKLQEWQKVEAWTPQLEFAQFLEEHVDDVLEPLGQDLLAIATDLEASSQGGYKGKVNLSNDNVSLAYQNEVETTVSIPKTIVLGIPLFEHGDRYRLTARLRFTVAGGNVKFRLHFTNLADAQEHEFEKIVQTAEEKLVRPIYRGRLATPW